VNADGVKQRQILFIHKMFCLLQIPFLFLQRRNADINLHDRLQSIHRSCRVGQTLSALLSE